MPLTLPRVVNKQQKDKFQWTCRYILLIAGGTFGGQITVVLMN